MASVWLNIQLHYGTGYAVSDSLPSDRPFYRGKDDVDLLMEVCALML